MSWSFSIGKLFGTEVRIHATFFLLILWIAVGAYIEAGASAALINIAFILALFACVVAHEFGHALMARRYGIHTPDITLLPIGGLARLDRMPEKPGAEIAVALAGPAVNVVIFVVLTLIIGASFDLTDLQNIEDPGRGFWGRLAALNLFLVVFNMVPAFPMDGGRVFRAVVAIWLGRVQATRIAASAGQLIAFLFGFWGLTSGNPVLLLIAVFVFVAAGAESSDVALRALARQMMAREAMITSFESLAPDDTLQVAENALIRTTQHEFPVKDLQGNLVGFLNRNKIFAASANSAKMTPVGEIMDTNIPMVSLTTSLDAALTPLYQTGVTAVVVTDRNGLMVGYITAENIGELMVIAGAKS